jgi:hypothetical protein
VLRGSIVAGNSLNFQALSGILFGYFQTKIYGEKKQEKNYRLNT